MTRPLTAILLAAVPEAALAHGGPFAHPHPHGIAFVLAAFAVGAAATAAWYLLRTRRDGDE